MKNIVLTLMLVLSFNVFSASELVGTNNTIIEIKIAGSEELWVDDYNNIDKKLESYISYDALRECKSYNGETQIDPTISNLKINYISKNIDTRTNIFEATSTRILGLVSDLFKPNYMDGQFFSYKVKTEYEATFNCLKY